MSVTTATRPLTAADRALVGLGHALADAGYEFTTVTPVTHERVNRRPGNERARDLRDVFGWSRPFGPGVLPPVVTDLMAAAGVLERRGDTCRSLVRFSSCDGDLLVHSAFPTVQPDAVFFGPDTYRLVRAVVSHVDGRAGRIGRAVDIGCGTGAGAIAIAKRRPDADVLAVDVNDAALRFTRVNAALAGLGNVRPERGDMLTGTDGEFDLVVSNPPFMVDAAGRAYRDGGGSDGHALTMRVVDAAIARLAPGGCLVLFTGTGIVDGHDRLGAAVTGRLTRAGLVAHYREVDPDVYSEELDGEAYAKVERIALVVVTARRPAAGDEDLT